MPLAPAQPDHEYCAICSALAAGRCASCHAPVCADCAELVHGGATTFAVCTRCEHDPSLVRAWASLVWPIAGVVLLAALIVGLVLALQ